MRRGPSPQIANEGLFVLAVATIETMLLDVLRYYLRWFPEKLGRRTFSIDKDDLLYRLRALVEEEIDKELNNVSYENIQSILEYFKKTLSLDEPLLSDDQRGQLREIKASRNLLLHNNLAVNRTYIDKAGPLKRAEKLGSQLTIEPPYLQDTLALADRLCDDIAAAITEKYKSYTKVAAIRQLWQYLFSSPVMKFDDYWQVDTVKDRVVSYRGSTYEDNRLLSNSEMMFLGMWRAHYHGRVTNMDSFAMYSLDSEHKSKMLFFLSILDGFRLE